ncbi:uncharacterized protein ACLA_044110 [Aspergillus clavatus NRRL 1]|uniref:BTB domain-containing protein n=1 Tax=Aspergillus clavatus (strain ATCC 1007 / CBS 513.65 / DSM 816 / NCTC 3887 / NRRL 1 / QM 1276 / 107) TaxID=344612 RepID=A1C8Q4_ASPCL|nr:uncharacterized protein ACLA_044110 [Aspergillus clavatus NRRL 1]EAW13691.1 conserved hypothetical protein [Aspergillus clavatus NRRL 1]
MPYHFVYHELDPDGNVILVFTIAERAPDAEHEHTKTGASTSPSGDSSTPRNTYESPAPGSANEPQDTESKNEPRRVRLSSKHRTLVSPVFRRMFNGPWKEAQNLAAGGCAQVQMYCWDAVAILILMNIIHSRSRQVPR